MPRKKLQKFDEIELRKNVLEPSKANYKTIKSHWSEHFANSNPIVLELACGAGEYTNGLAEIFPDKNFIGVDIKGDRIWQGSTTSIEKNLQNNAFLRCQVDHLLEFFGPNEVSEIWIVHPDPFLRDGDTHKRLTAPKFLDIYKQIMKPSGLLHLKTDNRQLYEYTLQTLASLNINIMHHTDDLHQSPYLSLHHGIQTYFEKKALAKNQAICYITFTLT
jgi:tRNA (guanine-N7-)-methyltransferase